MNAGARANSGPFGQVLYFAIKPISTSDPIRKSTIGVNTAGFPTVDTINCPAGYVSNGLQCVYAGGTGYCPPAYIYQGYIC